jgi:hypothetical protein
MRETVRVKLLDGFHVLAGGGRLRRAGGGSGSRGAGPPGGARRTLGETAPGECFCRAASSHATVYF